MTDDRSTHVDWTTVFVTADPVEAEMIKGLLEDGDIPALLRSLRISPFPETIGAFGQIEILVRKADREKALEVINRSHS